MIKVLRSLFILILTCATSVSVLFAQCDFGVEAGPDQTLCRNYSIPGVEETSFQLNGEIINGPILSFRWSGATGLDDFSDLMTTGSISETSTYYLIGTNRDGDNLITDGDFESATTDEFFTGYRIAPIRDSLILPGYLDVIPGIPPNPEFCETCDHTVGDPPGACSGGNFLVVNGSTAPNTPFWCQTITVEPNTEYSFSYWGANVDAEPADPPEPESAIRIVVDTEQDRMPPFEGVGGNNIPIDACGEWVLYEFTWFSDDASGDVDICMLENALGLNGNDFGIDDIEMFKLCEEEIDSVTITIEEPPTKNIDTIACVGEPVRIADITFDGITSFGNGTINETNDLCDTIVNVTITRIPEVRFFVTPTANVINCIDTTITITVEPIGPVDPSLIEYDWSTIGGNIIGRTDTTFIVVDEAGSYRVTPSFAQNAPVDCGVVDPFPVEIMKDITPPVASAGPDRAFGCGPDTMRLDGTGSEMNGRIFINWTTDDGIIVTDTTSYTPLIRGPGTYIISVLKDENGCTAQDTVVITEDVTEPDITLEDSLVFDCSQAEFILDATGTSTGDRYVYTWTATDGGTLIGRTDTLLATVTSTGKYFFEVVDTFNACVALDSIVVFGDTDPPVLDVGPDRVLTCDSTVFTLRGRYTGAGTNPMTVWTTIGGAILATINDSTITTNTAGRYVFSVMNRQTLCSSTDTVDITINRTEPTVVAGPDRELDCQTTFFDLDGTASDMGASLTPTWTTTGGNIVSGANTYTARVDRAGQYILSVRNSINGCIGRDTVQVTTDAGTPQIVLADTLDFDCSQAQFTLDATGSSTGPDFSYLWTATDGGTLVPPNNQITVNVTTPGKYYFRVTNTTNQCTALDSILVIGAFDPPLVMSGPDRELNCDSTEYVLTGMFSNGGNAPTENWRTVGGGIVTVITPGSVRIGAPGLYIYTVVNTETQCAASDTVLITENVTNPAAEAGPARTLDCDSLSVQLNGNGSATGAGITYSWTTEVGNILSGASSLTPRVNASGRYYITVSNSANGCTGIDSVDVTTSADFPNVSIALPDTINCVSDEITLDGSSSSSGADFGAAWTTVGGNIVSGGTTLTPRVNRAGTYTLTVTNTNSGCSNSAEVMVVEFTDQPSANAGPSGVVTCRDTILTLDGSGSSSGTNIAYSWAAGPGNIVDGANTAAPRIDQAGTYTLTVTDTRSLCTSTAQVVITEDTSDPTADAGAPATLDCATTELNLDGSGSSSGANITYLWTTMGGNILSGNTTTSPRIDAIGTYIITVTDENNGCTSSASVVVNESGDRPTAVAGPTRTINCNNATVQLNGAGSSTGADFSYLWTTSDGVIDNGATTLTPTVSAAGTYVLTVTDSRNNCTSASSVEVDTDFTPPNVSVLTPDLITCTMRQVTLDANNSDNGAGFAIRWTTIDGNIVSGSTSTRPTVDQIGTYKIVITNTQNGCQDSTEVLVQQDASIPLSAIAFPDSITCRDLMVTLDGAGSSSGSNIRYSWTASNGGNISGPTDQSTTMAQSTGTYTLTVTDDDTGCTSQDIVMVGENVNRPGVSAGPDFDIFCGQQNISITGTVVSSTGSVSARWSTIDGEIVGSNQGLTIFISSEGRYTLELEDSSNGCTSTDDVDVTLINLLQAELDVTQPDCENQLPVVDISPTSMGTAPYEFSLNDGNSFRQFPILFFEPETTYPILIRDAIGCEKRDTVVIGSIDTVSVEITRSPAGIIAPGTPVELSAVTDRPFGDLDTIIWSEFGSNDVPRYLNFPNIQNPTARPDSTVTYVVYVETFDNCVDTAGVTIFVQRPPDFYIPTVFSPNNDFINDFWTVYALDRVEIVEELRVFDRWGSMVYEVFNLNPGDESRGWNGRFNDEPVLPGVYPYMAKIRMDNETIVVSGDVTVIY